MSSIVPKRKIKVLIVDDSALIRSILREVINSYPDMEAVGAASHPLQAREMIKELNPDVLTLDVEMPEMDGSLINPSSLNGFKITFPCFSSLLNP